MKTKEEIIKEECEWFNLVGGEEPHGYDGDIDSIYISMDKYAEQEAIGFANFIVENSYLKTGGNSWYRLGGMLQYQPMFTDTELYKLYLNSKPSIQTEE